MPFALKLAVAIESIIDFDIMSNVKLHIRATTNLDYELYECVPQDLFNFLDSLNNQVTKVLWLATMVTAT